MNWFLCKNWKKGDDLIQLQLNKLEEIVNGEGLQESFHYIEMQGVLTLKKLRKGICLFRLLG